MTELHYQQPVWWTRHDFILGPKGRQWSLAGLELAAARLPQEWHFWMQRSSKQGEDVHEWQTCEGNTLAETPARFMRFVFRQASTHLTLLPRLADRSIVARPISPLFVSSGQETTLYVSSPVWVACYVEGINEPLLDVPVVIPNDTWFGPNPVLGELCYATKVTGRIDLHNVPPRPFRAVTPVQIRNNGSDSMPIERINIPAPYLSVHATESGYLWTPALTVTRENRNRRPTVHIAHDTDVHTEQTQQLTPARRSVDEHVLFRVFDSFFD
jgi:hypothetical protein